MTPDPLTAELLANGPFARDDAPYRLIEVAGAQAGEFLQRLCTQDVVGLAEGGVAPAAFLDAKGKLLATCLAFRVGGSFWLETQQEQAERLAALLERYHFTEKLTIVAPAAGSCHEWICAQRPGDEGGSAARENGAMVVRWDRHGVGFVRWHSGAPPRSGARAVLTTELAECLRMAAGLVRIGLETEPSTLALEAGLDDHCSTTKGCYTGQEIVARIHTYGHVNRKLCLLHLPAGPEITAPMPLHEIEDKVAVGRVLHAVPVPERPLRVGLGYLPKDFQALGTKLLLDDGGTVTVVGFAAEA